MCISVDGIIYHLYRLTSNGSTDLQYFSSASSKEFADEYLAPDMYLQ